MTPLKQMTHTRVNAIEHIKLLVNTYNITSDEIYGEEEFIKALNGAINESRNIL